MSYPFRTHNHSNVKGRLFRIAYFSNEPNTHEVCIWSDVNGWLDFMTVTYNGMKNPNIGQVDEYHQKTLIPQVATAFKELKG